MLGIRYGYQLVDELNEQEAVKFIESRENRERTINTLERIYQKKLTEDLTEIFSPNSLEIKRCINCAFERAIEEVRAGTFSKMHVPFLIFLKMHARNHAVDLLKDTKNSAFILSDIAMQYCQNRAVYKLEANNAIDLNSKLAMYKKKKLDFFIRRFFYLQDKQKIISEEKISLQKCQKLIEQFKREFSCGEEDLITIATTIAPTFLTDFYIRTENKKVRRIPTTMKPDDPNSSYAFNMKMKTVEIIVCFSIVAIGSIVVFILRLFMT